jgi:hypothetical protein
VTLGRVDGGIGHIAASRDDWVALTEEEEDEEGGSGAVVRWCG